MELILHCQTICQILSKNNFYNYNVIYTRYVIIFLKYYEYLRSKDVLESNCVKLITYASKLLIYVL